jgi:TonB family protein
MKTFALLALGLVALRCMRRQSAAARHWVLAVAIACSSAVPALEAIVPGWRLPAWPAITTSAPTVTITTSFAVPAAPDGQAAGSGAPRTIGDASPLAVLLSWFGRVQWAGAALGLLVLAVGLVRLEWIARHAAPVSSGRLAAIWIETLTELGITRPVRLRLIDHRPLLMTWGALRPIVVLPRAAHEWPDARVRAVLCHELAHVHRGDWLALMLAELLRTVDWLNPLTWVAARRLRLESELACDDVVLATGIPAPEYAGHLLAIARLSRLPHGRPALAASAMARPSGVERRIAAMLTVSLTRVPVSRSTRMVVAVSLLAAALLVSGYGLSAQALASFSGVVYDPQQLGVARATVSLNNPQAETRHEIRSDSTGRFEFVGLAPGDYQLEARVPGFEPLTRRVSIVARHTDQDLTLSLGTLNESVTVAYAPEPDKSTPPVPVRATAPRPQSLCEASTSGGSLRPPLKLRDVRPIYPAAVDPPEEGTVLIDARIGTDGTVVSASAREPVSAALAESATTAVNQWRFTPTLLNCVPVEVSMTVHVLFERRQSPARAR